MAIDVGANNATGTLSPRNSAFLLRNMASPRNIASPRSMESPRSMTLAQSTVASKYHAAYPPFKSTLPKRNCYFLGIWWLLALLLISHHVPRNSTISTRKVGLMQVYRLGQVPLSIQNRLSIPLQLLKTIAHQIHLSGLSFMWLVSHTL